MIENIRNVALSLAVAVVLPLVTHIGINLLIDAPDLKQFGYQSYNEDYKKAHEIFSKKYFLVAAAVGIASILVGAFAPVGGVAGGFIFGGALCFLSGYAYNWAYFTNVVKFITLLLALVTLVGISIWLARRDR